MEHARVKPRLMVAAVLLGVVVGLTIVNAAENATSRFLGNESTWSNAQVQLWDLHGLWGGTEIVIDGSGKTAMRIVEPNWGGGVPITFIEKEYSLSLSHPEAVKLLRLFVACDFLTIDTSHIRSVPDAGHPEIVLLNAQGASHRISKWTSDPHEQFDRIYQELLRVREQAQGAVPVFEGQFDWNKPAFLEELRREE